jgi:hypothetical protein
MVTNPSHTPTLSGVMYATMIRRFDKVLPAPEAIHYMDGIYNMKCMGVELAFKADENFGNVIKAWNYVIDQVCMGR